MKSAELKKDAVEKAEATEKAPHLALVETQQPVEEYPPETARYLSWAANSFIRTPTMAMLDFAVILLCCVIGACILLAYVIEINISVKGQVEITSDFGIRDAVTLADGFVTRLYKKTGDEVKEGEVVAVIASDGAPAEEIEKASRLLSQLNKGVQEFQPSSTLDFRPDRYDFSFLKINDPTLLRDLANVQQALRNFDEQKNRLKNQLDSEYRYTQERIDVLTEKLRKMKVSRQRELLQPYIESTNEELGRLKSQILMAKSQTKLKLNDALSELIRSTEIARGSLDNFKRLHEVRAPIGGIVAKIVSGESTHVTVNKSLLTIIPQNSTYVAHIRIPSKDMPKIRVGQKVLYKIQAYPYQRYGLFTGEVRSFDQVKTDIESQGDDSFVVKATIERPERLPPEVREKITFVVGMLGEAAVVTDRKSIKDLFVEKFFFDLTW